MVGLDYVINLIDKNFTGGMAAAKKNTQGLDTAVNKTTSDTRKLEGASKQGFGGMVKWAKRAAIATGLVFGIGQAMAFGNEVTNVTAQMEGYTNAIEFASGADGAKNLQFLDKTIKDLNLDMASSYKGFQTLTGSLKGTALEGKATRDIFDAVGVAASVMNLSAEQSDGAFLALSQMASKGKVQAEELRGQLGERIPGALGIAARAMGVNQIEFNKMLDSGQVYAEDFLPKFAKELKNTFQDGLPAAAQSMQAAINTKNNALLSFKNTVGTTMKPAIIEILKLKSVGFEVATNLIPAFQNLMAAFSPITEAFKNVTAAAGGTAGITDMLKNTLNALALVLNIVSHGIGFLIENYKIVVPVIAGVIIVQKAYALVQMAAAANTTILTMATHGLNAAIKANPIGFAIGLVIALVGAFKVAYEKVAFFRGGIDAAWEGLKGFAGVLKDLVINRIKEMISGITGLGSAIMHFFKGEWKEAVNAGKEAAKDMLGIDSAKQAAAGLKEVGKKAGEAYRKGYDEVGEKSKATAGQKVFGKDGATEADFLKGNVPTDNTKLSGAVSGSGGGGAGKNITFKIESLVKQLTIQPQTLKEGAQDIEKQVKDIFVRLIRDVELQTN